MYETCEKINMYFYSCLKFIYEVCFNKNCGKCHIDCKCYK